MRYSPKNHKWAVIQSGHCVYGTGRTRESALRDALRGLDNYDIKNVSELENELVRNIPGRHNPCADGDLYITDNAEDIKSYVENQ